MLGKIDWWIELVLLFNLGPCYLSWGSLFISSNFLSPDIKCWQLKPAEQEEGVLTLCLSFHEGCPMGWWMWCLGQAPRQEKPSSAILTCPSSPSREAHSQPSGSRRRALRTAKSFLWSWEAKTLQSSSMMPTWTSASQQLCGPALPTRCLSPLYCVLAAGGVHLLV